MNLALFEKFPRSHNPHILIIFPVEVAARGVDSNEIIGLNRQRDFQKTVVRFMFDGGGGEKGIAQFDGGLNLFEKHWVIGQDAMVFTQRIRAAKNLKLFTLAKFPDDR